MEIRRTVCRISALFLSLAIFIPARTDAADCMPRLSDPQLAEGSFQFKIESSNDVSATIFASSSFQNWTNIGAVQLTNGTGLFTEPLQTNFTARFYQAQGGTTGSRGNAVGFFKLALAAGRFKMIAHPLISTNNTIGALLPNVPEGCNFYHWTGSNWVIATYASFLNGWDHPELTLPPGGGGFILADQATTLTFVGEVAQGQLVLPIAGGVSLVSWLIPEPAQPSCSSLGMGDGDNLYQWNGQNFTIYTCASFFPGGWDPVAPNIAVGESFFVGSAGRTWVQGFNLCSP